MLNRLSDLPKCHHSHSEQILKINSPDSRESQSLLHALASSESLPLFCHPSQSSKHLIDKLIDQEGQGNSSVLQAYQLSQQILKKYLKFRLVVIIHCDKKNWHPTDLALLWYLTRAPSQVELFIVCSTSDCLPDGFDYHWLTPKPSHHEISSSVSNKPESTDEKKLFAKAQRAINDKAFEDAVYFLQQAKQMTESDQQKLIYQTQLDGLFLALKRFQQVDCASDIPEHLPLKLKFKIWQNRAWALTMLGQTEMATPYYQLLEEHQAQQSDPILLAYLKNIRALYEVKSGRWQKAMALELEIRKDLLQQTFPISMQLEYINAINLARLYFRQAQYSSCIQYLQKAAQSYQGCQAQGLPVVVFYRLSQAYFASGQTTKAKHYLIKACLEWLALPVPEAMALRSVKNLTGITDCPVWQVEPALSTTLLEHAIQIGIPIKETLPDILPKGEFAFAREFLASHEQNQSLTLLAGDDWALIFSPDSEFKSSPHRSQNYQILQHTLLDWFNQQVNLPEQPGYYLIDDVQEKRHSTDFSDLLSSASRWQCQTITLFDKTVAIPENQNHTYQIQLASGIQQLVVHNESFQARFNRFLPDQMLSKQEFQLLNRLQQEPMPLKQVQTKFPFSLSQLRIMEQKALVHIQANCPNELIHANR